MIASKTPTRISLGAGGTDLPAFYRRFGARFATSAGSKYVYVMVNRHPEKVVWMGMNNAERVDSPDQLKHRVVSRVLSWMGLTRNIEVVSISDVQSNSGVGTSSSFIVGLLKVLHAYKGEYPWPEEIAKEACYVERTLLQENGGIQDQYAAALGGIIWMEVSKKGEVSARRLGLKKDFVNELNKHLAFFYSRVQRESSSIQTSNTEAIRSNDDGVIRTLGRIQEIAIKIRRALEREDIGEFGALMNEHWRCKRQLSSVISNRMIDRVYRIALQSGALGGNLMGAGGGGHFMFVCKSSGAKESLRSRLLKEGLDMVDMSFDFKGSTLVDMS